MDLMDDASGNPGSSSLVSKKYTDDEIKISELDEV